MSRHHVGLNLHQIIAHAKSMKNIKENQTHSTAVDPADPAQELRGLEGQAVAAEHGEGRMKPGCDATRCNTMQHDAQAFYTKKNQKSLWDLLCYRAFSIRHGIVMVAMSWV